MLLARTADDRAILGTWVKLSSPESVEILAHAGFDFVVIDLEHTTLDLTACSTHIAMARALKERECVALLTDNLREEREALKSLEKAARRLSKEPATAAA